MTDDKMLDKVRKLLAKAERAGTEHEAETYTAKATELMLRYSIDEALLQQEHKSTEKIVTFRVEVQGYAKAKLRLMHEVARGLGLRSVEYTMSRAGWSKGAGQVVGWDSDVESFKVLFASLQMQAASEAKRELARIRAEWPELRRVRDEYEAARSAMEHDIWKLGAKADVSRMHCPNCKADRRGRAWLEADKTELSCAECGHTWEPVPNLTWREKEDMRRAWRDENPEPENPGDEPPHGRAFNQSFLIGYAAVVGNRLAQQRKQTIKTVDDERPGTALAVIDRTKAVEREYERLHPPSSFVSGGRGASNNANAGYYAGREAGARANIGSTSVGGGYRAIGRG